MGNSNIYYAKSNGLVVLKFVGDICYTSEGSYKLTSSLGSFLKELFEKKDLDDILIDLTETRSVDSTNLGLMAEITQFSILNLGKKATIISTNEDINIILDSIGFEQVFLILHNTQEKDIEYEELSKRDESEREVIHMILDAHKALSSISERNCKLFKSVVNVLEDAIKKCEQP